MGWILIICLLCSLSCTDKQKVLSGNEFPFHDGSGEVETVVLMPDNMRTLTATVEKQNGAYVHVGRYRGDESYFAMKFVTDSAVAVTVDSAFLWLSVNHVYKDAPGELQVEIYRVLQDWVESDNLSNLQFASEPIESITLSSEDSLYDYFRFPAGPVQEWIDNPSTNYGILVKSSGGDIVKEYYSSEGEPADELIGPTALLIYGRTATDTVLITSYSNNDISIISGTERLPSDRITIDNWEVYRHFVHFNFDSIPGNAFINSASIVLSLDGDQSIVKSIGTNFVIGQPVISANWEEGNPAYNDSVAFLSGYHDGQVGIDLTQAAQLWVSKAVPNYGFIILSSTEGIDFSRYSFYSAQADTALIPKLYLYYTLPVRRF